MPRIVEISDGIDVCEKPLKVRFQTVFSCLTVCKVDQKFCNWAKNIPMLVFIFIIEHAFIWIVKKTLF